MIATLSFLSTAQARSLADLILALHVLLAAFVMTFPFYVVLGSPRGWRFADSIVWRSCHLGCILWIAGEAWLDIACPLTTIEMALRHRAETATYQDGFIQHWLQRLLFYRAPASVFTFVYSMFAGAVVVTWWRYPPQRSRRQ